MPKEIPIKNVEHDRIRNCFEFDSKWFEMVRFLRNETDSILIRKRLENNRREKSYVIIFTLIHYFLFALSSLNCIVYLAFFTVTNFTKVSLFLTLYILLCHIHELVQFTFSTIST